MPKVALVMGSASDFPLMESCVRTLKRFHVEVCVRVLSAHRTPGEAAAFAASAEADGCSLLICAAGKAAALPGVMAAHTVLPVIGVPVKGSALDGMDALLSIVQMPAGVPVACVAIDGAENAALLAVQILSIAHPDLRGALAAHRREMAAAVRAADEATAKKAAEL